MAFPKEVKIVEVGARDGLQNEKEILPTDVKINFINKLAETGLKVIEATSFVSPKWIPQLADHSEVFAGITKKSNVAYPVLVPNVVGFEKALQVGVKEIAVFTTPSEKFSEKNTGCSVAESLKRIAAVTALAKQHNIKVRGYISCVLGCPYQGPMPAKDVAYIAKTLYELGCYEISLGDTIGVGTPFKTIELIEKVNEVVPIRQLAVHFHDTYGQAIANIYAALSLGISVIDSSVAGLGGCPYAIGASGNVATEDVIYLLKGLGIETGVDLAKLVEVGRMISRTLNRENRSKVGVAYKA